jgi:hypothetical protein
VANILAGLAAGGWPFLVGWIFPSAIFVSLAAFFLFPALANFEVAKDILSLSVGQRTLVLAFISIGLGILISAAQTPLYTLLEGYYWPRRIQNRRSQKYLTEKRELKEKVDRTSGIEQGLLYEQYNRFPPDDNQIAPSRLANRLRALETYGTSRFGLDTQILWSEVSTVAPEPLRTDHAQARATVDFFVSMIYLSAVFGLLSLVTAWLTAEGNRLGLAIVGLIALLATLAWHRLAIRSVDYWASTVQALTNLGRKELASSMGLQLPSTLDDEREMWAALSQIVYYGYRTDVAKQLDRFRASDPTSKEDKAD